MKCQGNFVFKSIEYVEAGEFKNPSGDLIKYPGSYKLALDEVKGDGKITGFTLKIPETSVDLINQLRMFKPYDKINLECVINFYANGVRVVPEKVQAIK